MFCYTAPGAATVQLVGDFTQWLKQPLNLRKSSHGIWWTAVRLERGPHYYRYIVDGEWCDDPECSHFVPNPFGSQNGVRYVH